MNHSFQLGTDVNHKPPYFSSPVNSSTPKKKPLRRLHQDHSQFYRSSFQVSFLALNLVLGAIFYFWMRQFESGSAAYSLERPAGVEGWLPIAGLMNLKYWLATGHIPEVHLAAMFLLLSFLAMAFLLRKSFCSWLCPVDTVSEYLWRLGRKLFYRNFHLSRWIDLPLRSLKYLLLAFFAWAVYSMSPAGIRDFMQSPYGLSADVKMLNFFRHIGETGLGLAAFFSPARIRRSKEPCIDCAKCAKACPAALPVDNPSNIWFHKPIPPSIPCLKQTV
jgi:polyferredoxin